jgi:hypothetical protein
MKMRIESTAPRRTRRLPSPPVRHTSLPPFSSEPVMHRVGGWAGWGVATGVAVAVGVAVEPATAADFGAGVCVGLAVAVAGGELVAVGDGAAVGVLVAVRVTVAVASAAAIDVGTSLPTMPALSSESTIVSMRLATRRRWNDMLPPQAGSGGAKRPRVYAAIERRSLPHRHAQAAPSGIWPALTIRLATATYQRPEHRRAKLIRDSNPVPTRLIRPAAHDCVRRAPALWSGDRAIETVEWEPCAAPARASRAASTGGAAWRA